MRQSVAAFLVFVALAAALLVCVERRKSLRAHQRTQGSTWYEPPPPEAAAPARRSVVKSQLARRVVAEGIPLLEAAELFREANGEAGLRVLVAGQPGRSTREKLCRQVIGYVTGAEAEQGMSPRVSVALREEFERRLAAGEFPPEPGLE